jgi:hypothetical protein
MLRGNEGEGIGRSSGFESKGAFSVFFWAGLVGVSRLFTFVLGLAEDDMGCIVYIC